MKLKDLKKISKTIGLKDVAIIEKVVERFNAMPKKRRLLIALKLIFGKL
jgi:hypothetical protein